MKMRPFQFLIDPTFVRPAQRSGVLVIRTTFRGSHPQFFTINTLLCTYKNSEIFAAPVREMWVIERLGVTLTAFKAFHSFVRSGEANGDHIATTVPMRAQNRHHIPHLPVLRTGKAVLPGIHHRCCNSHFGSQVKRGHSVLAELRLDPVCHGFHLHRQRFKLWLFPRLWREFHGNMPVCKTQQGYSPPMGARETEGVGFSRFRGSIREFIGEFSPQSSPFCGGEGDERTRTGKSPSKREGKQS